MTCSARTDSISDGVTDEFPIGFPFLDRSHMKVYVTPPGEFAPAEYTGTVTWLSDSNVQLTPVPASGSAVSRRRETPTASLIDIMSGGSTISADEINLVHTQLLYAIQENLCYAADVDLEAVILDLRYTYDVVLIGVDQFDEEDKFGPVAITRTVTLPAAAAGSTYAVLGLPTTQSHIMELHKVTSLGADTVVGTVTVTTAGVVTLDVSNAVQFEAGDYTYFETTQAGGMTQFGITLRMRRDS